MGQTYTEKIIQQYSVDQDPDQSPSIGDYLNISPLHVMSHDNTSSIISKFLKLNSNIIHNPDQLVFTIDHNIQDHSDENLQKYSLIQDFADSHNIDFYPAGRGIGHQIMCEEGYAWPGSLVVASDSHSNMYGGLGCLGTPIVRTDAASLWATGKTWWQIPPISKVILNGKLPHGVTGKDIIISLCGYFNNDEVLNHIVEFTGEGLSSLSIDQRLTISNMTTEWGALAGIFPPDLITLNWLKHREKFFKRIYSKFNGSDSSSDLLSHPRINQKSISQLESDISTLCADPNAYYEKELKIDLSTIQPHVSGPNDVKAMLSISDIQKKNIPIDKAYLVSCVNSRVSDLAEAAKIVKGKKVANGVEFYIAAASSEVQQESEQLGDWKILTDAGAIVLPPGCGPCIGHGAGTLKDNEVVISSTNRNFKGRMGSPNAFAYLASPTVVAYSAIVGKIDLEGNWDSSKAKYDVRINNKQKNSTRKINLIEGFPSIIQGNIVFCNSNNLNTDGIFPSEFTYKDNMTLEQQSDVVMKNYDPNFKNIAKKNDILVSGFNFGTGSSREQAVTALKSFGIQLVIAGSFSETFKRNSFNNGFLSIESPDLIEYLSSTFASDSLTISTGLSLIVNLSESLIQLGDKTYPITPLGHVVQSLIVENGIENWIKKYHPK